MVRLYALDRRNDEVNGQVLIKHMVGRSIENIYPPAYPNLKKQFPRSKNWNAFDPKLGRKVLNNVNFYVRKGKLWDSPVL